MYRSFALLFLLAVVLTDGCKSKEPAASPVRTQLGTPPATAPEGGVETGTIRGIIHFEGRPPERTPIDMSMDPACSMPRGENAEEELVVSKGRLANVYIYVKAGAPSAPAPDNAAAVVMDQRGCRYVPHVIALQRGGTVEFRNSDSTMHNVHPMAGLPGNFGLDVSQRPMGQPVHRQFTQPETMLRVRCDIHPWMNAYINIADNPFFAVSDADGSFTITGLPPGNYTLAAVHEKLGEQDLQISISAKSTAKADFSFAGT